MNFPNVLHWSFVSSVLYNFEKKLQKFKYENETNNVR